MANVLRNEMRRPTPIVLAALAALGWVFVLILLFSRSSLEADLTEQINTGEAQTVQIQSQLTQTQEQLAAQQEATSTLADLQIRIDAAGAELAGAASERDRVESDLSQAQSRLAELQGEVETQGGSLQGLQTELQDAGNELQSRQAELADTEARIGVQTQALVEIGARVEAARTEEGESRQTVAKLSEDAARLAEEAAGAEARVQEARVAEASVQEQLQTARLESSRIAEQRTDMEQSVATLSTRREQLAADVAASEEQRQALQGQVTELAANLNQRSDELAELERRVEELQSAGATSSGLATEGLTPGQYQAGPVQAYFASDGTFRMTSDQGTRNVTGRFSVTDNVLTLEDAIGETGTATFPMRCRITPEANGFSLSTLEESCAALSGVLFERSN